MRGVQAISGLEEQYSEAREITMGQYGAVAVRARELFVQGLADSPEEAWKRAAEEICNTEASREKCCPKCAFLGLCEEGLVKGIRRGQYTQSRDNRRYAVDAVALIRVKPSLAENERLLWCAVAKGKRANSQMDVVISLWKKGLIA